VLTTARDDVQHGAAAARSPFSREGVPLNIIQRQLAHANLGATSIYLQRIDPEEIITAARAARP
jgi:hypothetical protein